LKLDCNAKQNILKKVFVIGKMQTTLKMNTDHPSCKMQENGMENQQANTVELNTGKALTSSKVEK